MQHLFHTPLLRLTAQSTINSTMAMGLGYWGAHHPWLALATCTLAAGASGWLWRSAQAWRTMGVATVIGYGWEVYATAFNLYTYTTPQVAGIPLFVGPMWAVVAMFAVSLYHYFTPPAPSPAP